MVKLTDQKGIVLPIVLVLIAIMLLLGITVVSVINYDSKTIYSLNSSEQALHIAEAGYNKYLWLLNNDTYFYKFGENEDEGFRIESTYVASENQEWAGYTKAYEKTAYSSGNKLIGYFKVEVTPPTISNPVVGVKSTGWTADSSAYRTIYVEIHKRMFTNYVIFENGEGKGVYFSSDSRIKGPYFSNGDLLAYSGAKFFDFVGYVKNKDVKGVDFAKEPVKMSRLQMPATNSELTVWGYPDNGGYTYTGRTYILLDNKTLKIRQSDGTLSDNVSHPESGVIYIKSDINDRGDLYISGVLDGRLTIIAEGDIYICAKDPTDNTIRNNQKEYNEAYNYQGITYASGDESIPTYENKNPANISDDMLGLVTDNDIIIHNRTNNWPVANDGSVFTAVENLKIQAALYCRTVRMQDLNYFKRNNKNLKQIKYIGSMVVRYPSATGFTNGSGYSSDNQFDYRMSYDAPPHFTEPVNSGWEVKSWREVSSQEPLP